MIKSNTTYTITVTEEQILELVKKHFTEEWCEEDGYGWTEFAGKFDAFVKFARAMYEEGYDQGCFEATGGQ